MQKITALNDNVDFGSGMKKVLVHDSYNFKVLNFNLKAGQDFPVHSHDADGEVSILVLEGQGQFLGDEGKAVDCKAGDVLVSDIRDPHGVRAVSDLRILVTIAPPI